VFQREKEEENYGGLKIRRVWMFYKKGVEWVNVLGNGHVKKDLRHHVMSVSQPPTTHSNIYKHHFYKSSK